LVFVDDGWQSTCGGGLGIMFFRQVSVLSLPLPNTVSLLLESVLHCCVPGVYCLCCTWSDFELRTVGLTSNLRWRVARSSRTRFSLFFTSGNSALVHGSTRQILGTIKLTRI